MLGDKVEETEQAFHTPHEFCHKMCYPHPPPPEHDMSQNIVFALCYVHSDISGKTKSCHSIIKMAEGTRRCVGARSNMNLEYVEAEVGEEYPLSKDNGSDYEAVHLHTLVLSTGNLHTLSQQIMITAVF